MKVSDVSEVSPPPESPTADTLPHAGDFASAQRLRSVRSRFRENSHEEAHDAEMPDPIDLPEHPLIPRGKPVIITDSLGLADLIDELRRPQPAFGGDPCFAYDSEFIGESTYHPRLCLIQVATPRQVALIDPLAGIDLTPFWELLGDTSIRKIVHAGEQDLEPAVRLAGVSPINVIDTQVIAGFCALPYPASLAKLVEHVTGVRLGKGLTFTQWDQRPLSKKQLAYAADDVRFLPATAAAMIQTLEQANLLEWAGEECARRCSAEALVDSQEPYERVKGGGGLSGQQMAILRELAAWRNSAAREADLPPRALLRDEVLVTLSRRPPKEISALGQIRHMPRPVAERYGRIIMEAIQRGRSAEPLATRSRGPEASLTEKFTADAAWSLLQTLASAKGIDPNLLASRRETENFTRRALAGKSVEKQPLMQGWRREAAGELLLRLLTGDAEARLGWSQGRPRLALEASSAQTV